MLNQNITLQINTLMKYSRTLADVHRELQEDILRQIKEIQKSCPHDKVSFNSYYEDSYLSCDICGSEDIKK